jgi:uncharacterized repeat protein (TIGR03803 family)
MSGRARFRSAIAIALACAFVTGCGGAQAPIGVPPSSSSADLTAQKTRQNVTYEVLYSFHRRGFNGNKNDGRHPTVGLIDVDGTFYGTTYYGGTNGCRVFRAQKPGCGSVFSITPSGTETVLYRFRGKQGDGAAPDAALINVDGTFYGTTHNGGSGFGTVFSMTSSGTESIVHAFTGEPTDGSRPASALVNVDGTLYGTTNSGGASDDGTVFSIAASGAETVLHSFAGEPSDGSGPVSALVNINGTLYGTTGSGGANDDGTVFSITPSGTETVLYSFKGAPTDGETPSGALLDVHGTLYGVTQDGGAHTYWGTVFSVTPSGTEKVLYSFKGAHHDGSGPVGALIDAHGTLYGVTPGGGARRYGTVFSITPSRTEEVLHNFEGGPGDGANPEGALLSLKGTLYGTTWRGGNNKEGTVFVLTP